MAVRIVRSGASVPGRRSLLVPPVERQLQLAHVVKVRAEDVGRLLQLGEPPGH